MSLAQIRKHGREEGGGGGRGGSGGAASLQKSSFFSVPTYLGISSEHFNFVTTSFVPLKVHNFSSVALH
jgi:hypothetical protein